jgi:tripartite-type tricarboxylate transporter receptor subunit TctC
MRGGKTLNVLALLLGLLLVVCLVAPTLAMDKPKGFPKRPITIIVPYGAGGGSDQLTRAMAGSLEKVIEEPISVVNKPGGGGVAGLSDFFMAPADGYTLTEHIDDAASLYAAGTIKEHPAEVWFPICIAQVTFSQLYIRPDEERFSNWQELLAYAKENPGKLQLGNVAHEGSMERVNMYLLQEATGFKVTQVSFDKPAERYAALVGGHIDVLFEQPGDVRPYMESGDMKPILTFLKSRPGVFSDVPCLPDVGADFTPLLRWRGFFAKKGVPQDRLEYLEWAFKEAWNSDSFQKFNKSKYMDLIDSYRNMEQGKKLVKDSVETYKKVFKKLGIGQ